MNCSISRAVLERLQALAAAAKQAEICGLLLGEEGRITSFLAVPNAASDPVAGFELDTAAHLAASREARAAGLAIIGCYHSHPAGPAIPSRADAAGALEAGRYWLILGADEARLWLSRPDGAFDPVSLHIAALQPSPPSANRGEAA
jgi:proteasome lid subunit RPN8/RPN11